MPPIYGRHSIWIRYDGNAGKIGRERRELAGIDKTTRRIRIALVSCLGVPRPQTEGKILVLRGSALASPIRVWCTAPPRQGSRHRDIQDRHNARQDSRQGASASAESVAPLERSTTTALKDNDLGFHCAHSGHRKDECQASVITRPEMTHVRAPPLHALTTKTTVLMLIIPPSKHLKATVNSDLGQDPLPRPQVSPIGYGYAVTGNLLALVCIL